MNDMSSLADFTAHYKAVRHRIEHAPRPVAPVAVAAPEPAPPAPKPPRKARKPKVAPSVVFHDPIGPYRPSLRQIMYQVAVKHGVTVHDMCGPWRMAQIANARLEYYYRARTETHNSFPEIGRRLGERDHSTVMSGYRKFRGLLAAGSVTVSPPSMHGVAS